MEWLRDMPWSALPLNPIMVKHEDDKMAQCVSIFKRFVARDGPFALNISYATYLETKQRFEGCHRRHIMLTDLCNDSLSKMQLQRDMLCIFDTVIPDVVDNLENVANRFNAQRIMLRDT